MPTPGPTRWHVAATPDDWLARALAWVAEAEAEALAARGEFHVVLAGGGTPALLYRALADEDHDWPHWRIWFGDERCLPVDHPERNSVMARQNGLDSLTARGALLYPIAAERGARTGALAYAGELSGLAEFDLVLLGLGQDGHTASLFPGQDWDEKGEADVLAVGDAPKPPPDRVSLSAGRLSRARKVVFLVKGADKRLALARWRNGEALPAAAIRPGAGVDVLMDSDACPIGEAT